MVDFVAVIAKAVDGLGDNRPETREAIYDRARATITRQLDQIDPPVSDAVRQEQLEKLEAAIAEVENLNTESAVEEFEAILNEAVAEEPEATPQTADMPVSEDAVPTADEEAPEVGPEAVVAEPDAPAIAEPEDAPMTDPAATAEPDEAAIAERDEAGIAEPDEAGSAQSDDTTVVSPDDDAAVSDAPAADIVTDPETARDDRVESPEPQGSDQQATTPPPPFLQDNTVPDYVAPPRSRSGGIIAAAAILLFIVVGAVAAFFYLRGPDSERSAAAPAEETETAAVAVEEEAPGPEEQAETSDIAGAAPEVADGDTRTSKFNQRLLADGTEIDTGPAPGDEASALAEGMSIAALDRTPVDRQPSADSVAQSPAAAQRMLLYEDRLGQQAPTVSEGSVVWSIVSESPGEAAPPEPAIQADVTLPERGLSAVLTIKRNADLSLPASHLIEIIFVLTGAFEGSGIGSIQNFALKNTEEETGDSLIAVPAKITDSFFMIALNDYVEAVEFNMQLLQERNWIDLPIVYGNGRRALLTLEKGSTGTEVFNQVIRAWEARNVGSADSADTAEPEE